MTAKTQEAAAEKMEDDLLEEFVQDLELQGRTEETIRTYRSPLEMYFQWLDKDPRDIEREDLKGYLNYLKNTREGKNGAPGLSTSTINNYFSALSTFYRFLEFEGYVDKNLLPAFRERYIKSWRESNGEERQLISVEEMSTLVHATLNVRDKAIITLLAKTGVRRNELVSMDVDDVDWESQSIKLEATAKRSNLTVFFDGECRRVLQRWMKAREEENPDSPALFTNQYGGRLKRNGIYEVVTKHAESVDLHDSSSEDLEDKFTPHCCRHWFTTHLRRSGMDREFIKELRGDERGDNIDVYDHIDKEELREAYLAHIPSLGI